MWWGLMCTCALCTLDNPAMFIAFFCDSAAIYWRSYLPAGSSLLYVLYQYLYVYVSALAWELGRGWKGDFHLEV